MRRATYTTLNFMEMKTKAEYDEAYAKERMIIQLIAAKNPALGELLGAI